MEAVVERKVCAVNTTTRSHTELIHKTKLASLNNNIVNLDDVHKSRFSFRLEIATKGRLTPIFSLLPIRAYSDFRTEFVVVIDKMITR